MSDLNSIDYEKNSKEENQDTSKFPKSVPFIVANVFFERYCTAGVLGNKNHSRIIKKIKNILYSYPSIIFP